MVGRRVVWGDCWMRVLRRSAGWRRKAERIPVERPAKKWNAQEGLVRGSGVFGRWGEFT
jgi:hypothetical protein